MRQYLQMNSCGSWIGILQKLLGYIRFDERVSNIAAIQHFLQAYLKNVEGVSALIHLYTMS